MLSVIIPTYNEAGVVGRTVRHVLGAKRGGQDLEVIVVDGGSTDGTVREAEAAGARVVHASQKGRAAQMNAGAEVAQGELLFFLHADTLPPTDMYEQVMDAHAGGAGCGCMRLRFDRPHWALRLKAWFSRFSASGLHYGDQGLFVRRDHFQAVGGYRDDMIVFEDLDIIQRLRKVCRFSVLPGPITTSARKYARNSALRMQLTFYLMYPLYRMGASQATLVSCYTRLIRQDKI